MSEPANYFDPSIYLSTEEQLELKKCIMAIAFELGDQMEDCPHYDVLRDRLIAKIRELKSALEIATSHLESLKEAGSPVACEALARIHGQLSPRGRISHTDADITR